MEVWQLKSQKNNTPKIKDRKMSRDSKDSCLSSRSESSSVFQEKLRRFEETHKNEAHFRNLQLVGENRKRKLRRSYRSPSITKGTSCPTKVSTMWGQRKNSGHDIEIKDLPVVASERRMSRFSNNYVPKKSSFLAIVEDLAIPSQMSIQSIAISSTARSSKFQPFHFFLIYKGEIKVQSVCDVSLDSFTHKLRVFCEGFFSHSISFRKYPSIFDN